MRPAANGYLEEVAKACGDAKAACNWLKKQVQVVLMQSGGDLASFAVPAVRLGSLIARQKEKGLNNKLAADVFARMIADGSDADAAMAALNITLMDDSAVVEAVRRAMAANPKAVADYK